MPCLFVMLVYDVKAAACRRFLAVSQGTRSTGHEQADPYESWYVEMATVTLSLHAKQPKTCLLSLYRTLRIPAWQAVITYRRKMDHKKQRTAKALQHEVLFDVVPAVSRKGNHSTPKRSCQRDLMTQLRKDWGLVTEEE